MKIAPLMAGVVLVMGIGLADAASAATGYVSRTVNLRAGPGGDYPLIGQLRRGSTLQIYGCLHDWDWCEVGVRPYRGWVSGDYLQTVHRKKRVRVIDAGPIVHIPIVTFEVGPYWDAHYRDRPFYKDRDRWMPRRDDRYDRNDRNGRQGWNDRDDRNDRNDRNDWRDDDDRGNRGYR